MDLWNYIELLNLAGYIYFMVVWWMYVTGHDFAHFRRRDLDEFKNLYIVAEEFNAGAHVAFGCITFMSMRFFKYFRLSDKCRMLWDTFRKSLLIILPLLLVFMAFLLAFTCSGHWLFGHRVHVFSSMSDTFMYLLLSAKDGVDLEAMKDASPVGAPLWFIAWYLLSKVIIIGLIIAVTTAVFGEMLHVFQLQSTARADAEKKGAKIPRLREYFMRDFCPTLLSLSGSKDAYEVIENHMELKETLQEVDLEELLERAIQGLKDNEFALDAAELTFLFGGGETAEKNARHFINRLCNLVKLHRSAREAQPDLEGEIEGLEEKVEDIVTHIHASRKSLERRFGKLRPYIAKAQENMLAAQKEKSETEMVPTLSDQDRHLRYVFKDYMFIGETNYLVEMSTVGRELQISAYDSKQERTLELIFKDDAYDRVLSEAALEYANIAQRLRHGFAFGEEGEEIKLELGPPQTGITPTSQVTHHASARKPRPGNSVFPDVEDGPKPPQRGQLAVAAAVLDSQRRGSPLSVGVAKIAMKPTVQSFLKAAPLKRVA